jgi:inner membrane protein
MLVGAVAGAFPDIDYIASWIDPMVYLTLWHRSITHSFVMLPLWAFLVGVVLAFALRTRHEWRFISLLAGVSVVSHILSDLITVYGTQILAPLSDWRASIGTTFVIDPWFTLIIVLGFLTGLRDSTRYLPGISLVVLAGYIGFQAVLKHQALAIAQQHIPRESRDGAKATALPQPFSPFNWKLITTVAERYEVTYINLAGGYSTQAHGTGLWAQIKQTYRRPEDSSWQRYYRYSGDEHAIDWVREIWAHSQLDYFRRFAMFPVLYRIDRGGAETCVWFTDLRYVLPYMTPPFRYGLCGGEDASSWAVRRLRGSDRVIQDPRESPLQSLPPQGSPEEPSARAAKPPVVGIFWRLRLPVLGQPPSIDLPTAGSSPSGRSHAEATDGAQYGKSLQKVTIP